jgi:flagellar biogenesis protein FliO
MYVDKDILQAANVVSVELQPAGVDSVRIQDMAQLFGLMVLVLVSVWGAKQLLRIFSDDTTKD